MVDAYGKVLWLVQEAEQEKTLARAVQLKLKGQWSKWCSFDGMDLSRTLILSIPPSFCRGATLNTLPLQSIDNACPWCM